MKFKQRNESPNHPARTIEKSTSHPDKTIEEHHSHRQNEEGEGQIQDLHNIILTLCGEVSPCTSLMLF